MKGLLESKSWLTALLLLVGFQYPGLAQVPTSGLVSYYPFESSTSDEHGSNDGTAVGDVSFVPGLASCGQAINLPGEEDYVDLGNPVDLQLQDFTISAWVKFSTLPPDSADAAIVSYGENG